MVGLRALKVLVAVMGALIVAGTVALVALIVQRAGGGLSASAPTGPRAEFSLGQPPGTRVLGLAGAGERLALWVSRPDGGGHRVLFLDPRTGRVLGEARASDD